MKQIPIMTHYLRQTYLLTIVVLLIIDFSTLTAQEIRVEGFAGNEAPSIDVFWVEPFLRGSQFLYLSRNTFSVPDYKKQSGNFSTLNILGYQIKKTGFGIALAITATTNSPLQARGGLQFLKVKPEKWLIYSIVSSKLGGNADARWLTIGQFTPEITEKADLFARAEWVTSIGFSDTHRFSASIIRLGLQLNKWQFGPGADFLWVGSEVANASANYGIFVTHLF